MKNIVLVLMTIIGFASCGTNYVGPEHASYISYFPIENQVYEHTSFQNEDGKQLHETLKDSSFFSQFSENTVFAKHNKTAIGEYLVSHLKAMKTLRLLAVTHAYDIASQKSSYYICYLKNKNMDKKWGCKLNYSNGKYRLEFQNINALKDKEFVANYYKLFSPEDVKKLIP